MILEIICKLFGLNIKDYDSNSTDPEDMSRLYDDMVKNKDYKLNPPKITKIETADCVLAIIDYFKSKNTDTNSPLLNQKLWKRVSKTGSGNSIKREFENKKTGDKVYIISSETEILNVNGQSIITKFDNFTKNEIEKKLKKTLSRLQNKLEEDFEDFGGIYYNSKLDTVWLDVSDGFEPEEEVEKEFLKIVSKVRIEYEHDPKSDEKEISNDWVEIDY